ncbi:MAG: hypothetical protein WCO67_27010 [Betaproteobacteria bacterium]
MNTLGGRVCAAGWLTVGEHRLVRLEARRRFVQINPDSSNERAEVAPQGAPARFLFMVAEARSGPNPAARR